MSRLLDRSAYLFSCLTMAASLAACTSTPGSTTDLNSTPAATAALPAPPVRITIPPQKQLAPQILSLTKVGGKGVPNGRSDSEAPFSTLTGVSSDPSYGYTEAHPIFVGNGQAMGGMPGEGPRNESMYLNALRSASGQPISYERLGSCCRFSTPRGVPGSGGLLDVFTITTPDSKQPVLLYLNMYDPGEKLAPLGFTFRSQP